MVDNNRKCTSFTTDDYDTNASWEMLMRCPHCKGWLPQDFPLAMQFKCKKCGKTLETLPSIPDTWTNIKGETETVPEDLDYEWGGRLCVVPDVAIRKEAQ